MPNRTDFSLIEDKVLVEMTLLGNMNAFEELVRRYERAVKDAAYRVTGNRFSAEDAAQDALVCAWMQLSTLREKEKFGGFGLRHRKAQGAGLSSPLPGVHPAPQS